MEGRTLAQKGAMGAILLVGVSAATGGTTSVDKDFDFQSNFRITQPITVGQSEFEAEFYSAYESGQVTVANYTERYAQFETFQGLVAQVAPGDVFDIPCTEDSIAGVIKLVKGPGRVHVDEQALCGDLVMIASAKTADPSTNSGSTREDKNGQASGTAEGSGDNALSGTTLADDGMTTQDFASNLAIECPCSYENKYDLSFVLKSSGGAYVTATVVNNSAVTSNQHRLVLWATDSPYSGGQLSGFKLAESNKYPEVNPGESFRHSNTGLVQLGSGFSVPDSGSYSITLTLKQCLRDITFCEDYETVAFHTFDDTETFGDGGDGGDGGGGGGDGSDGGTDGGPSAPGPGGGGSIGPALGLLLALAWGFRGFSVIGNRS